MLCGQNRSGEHHNFWVLLTEVMRVGVEDGPHFLRYSFIVSPRVREDGVALPDESLGKELAEVAEPKDGDFEGVGAVELGLEVGFVVVWLSCVD